MIRGDSVWMATAPLDMRADTVLFSFSDHVGLLKHILLIISGTFFNQSLNFWIPFL